MSVSVIVTALVSAVANLAEPAVRDAYNFMKSTLKRKFGENKEVLTVVDRLESDPSTWQQPATQVLQDAEVSQDADVMKAYEDLKKVLENLASFGSSVSLKGEQTGDNNVQQIIQSMSGNARAVGNMKENEDKD